MPKLTRYTFDGSTLVAGSPTELVGLMHAVSWSQSKDDQDFMRSLADRLIVQSSIEVRFDTADHLVEDLLKYGVLTAEAA